MGERRNDSTVRAASHLASTARKGNASSSKEDCLMRIQRLSWAGIKLESSPYVVLVDPLLNCERLRTFMDEPKLEIVSSLQAGIADAILITHLHPDHYDPSAIRHWLRPNGALLCPTSATQRTETDGFSATGIAVNESLAIGHLKITAVPAVDGFGDDQVSWVIETEGQRIIHCGDTLWHGYWWKIAKEMAPFALAILPINGVKTRFKGLQPSGIEAAMTPKQAAAAAGLLRAQAACPMHYEMFNSPPLYAEHPCAEREFVEAARLLNLSVRLLRPGDEIELQTMN
jgi:L-ascorbate metabolism protein UlaG (beta-lactamase superfamily)